MTDRFFTTQNCDRCQASLGNTRKMSWFTEDCLCDRCIENEAYLRKELENKGIKVHDLEGCGYLPTLDDKK